MKLNTLFQNGAVFQQNTPIPVWGKTEPWHKVKCEFAGQEIYSKSNESGKFLLRFAPVPAGGPYTLTVTDLISGEIIRVEDILVGEVWVASGQSNMSYTLGDDATISVPEEIRVPAKVNREQEAEFCSTIPADRTTRYISLARVASGLHEESFEASWKTLTPETAPQLSAVAAWFGRYIQEKKNVPVGLIISAWGGTRVEAWTSRAGLRSNPETAAVLDDLDHEMQLDINWNTSEQPVAPEGIPDPGNEGFKLGYADPELDDNDWNRIKVPGSWIKQKIAGNGAVWVRTKIEIPNDWCGKELVLELGGIDKLDTTYFNGVQIGKTGEGLDTSFWNKPRKYTIPAGLVHPGINVIAIRAFSFQYDGAFLGREAEYGIRVRGTEDFLTVTEPWKAKVEIDFGILTPCGLNPAPGNPNSPGILFDSMIRPLLPYAIRGVIWYQGESNATTLENSTVYLERMKTMIRDWRYHWELGNFPFIQVQLANFLPEPEPVYNPQSPWALIRESQALACQEPNTYMIPAIDIGCTNDIHPQDKKNVGKRLADTALHHIYHVPGVIPSGPVCEKAEHESGKVRISFRYGEGLQITGDVSESFYIAERNGIFYPADWYQIEGTSLLLGSSRLKAPCNVRYCWSSDPKAILFNGAGLPAAPFRTDSYAIVD